MNKIKEFLLSVNFIVLMFVSICTRSVVFGASIGDALAILSLCSLYGFKTYVEHLKHTLEHNKDQQDKLRDIEKLNKDVEDLKSAFTGIKLQNSIKPTVTTASPNANSRFF